MPIYDTFYRPRDLVGVAVEILFDEETGEGKARCLLDKRGHDLLAKGHELAMAGSCDRAEPVDATSAPPEHPHAKRVMHAMRVTHFALIDDRVDLVWRDPPLDRRDIAKRAERSAEGPKLIPLSEKAR